MKVTKRNPSADAAFPILTLRVIGITDRGRAYSGFPPFPGRIWSLRARRFIREMSATRWG